MTPIFAYDAVEYPTVALSQAHPGHLHAVARMYGLDPVPPDRCRYLEIGCGDGTHLIACALALPGATFAGIDLSATAVERGTRMIAELGLPNVTLYAADLTTWQPADGFDYAVAHGLYSWVPPPVRDGLLGLLARVLPPHGVGYVSYNTYPGCYVRRMVWEMLRFHTADVADPGEKVRQAVEMARLLIAGRRPATAEDAAAALLDPELNRIVQDEDPRVLYHDDLGEVNDPVYFHQFAAHAGRAGLRFVAEAEPQLMETRGFPPTVAGVLAGLASRDVLRKEQYLDFLLVRRFRMSLLARDGAAPAADPIAARITELGVSGNPKPERSPVDLAPGAAVTFTAARGATARTDLPIGKAALGVLAERWPGRVPFADLARAAAGKLGREATPADTAALAEFLTAVWSTGMIGLHGDQPRYVETVSARPMASPLARLQARTGPMVTSLLHNTVRLDDAPSRRMLEVMDGTRNLVQIAAEVLAAIPPEKRPPPTAFRAALDQKLQGLARAGLLVG